ncbi:MAG: hypothetical protein Q9216_002114 [Gyalolechia sp. 2 TL-2023]
MAGGNPGPQCKFSHELGPGDVASKKPQQSHTGPRPRTDIETSFRNWTFLIPKQNTRYLIPEIGKFFQLGWEILSTDPTETGQQVIKKLATEEGLAMIKTLTDRQGSGGLQISLDNFKDETLPFLRTISHPDVLSSLILETPLETICTFLFGPNGRRAVSLFKSTATIVGSCASHTVIQDEEFLTVAVTTCLSALERIVELNQGAQVIDEFTSILNDLTADIPVRFLEAGSRSLARLQRRLGIGATIPLLEHRLDKPASIRPVFTLGQDLPGALSDLGRRHDNDHASIVDIKILPTTQEIQSTRVEYLPSNNPTKHHLPGLAGLLDRQFRLLREDTVGQLRDAVQYEYQRLNKSTNAQTSSKRQRNGARNIVYQNVALLRLEFDRKKGLEVVVEFDQPIPLAQKTPKEREEWWTNSRRLLVDSFVCLVSSTGQAIFFSVCDPTPTAPPKDKDGNDRKDRLADYLRAFNERPNLFQNPKRATLMLSLVEENAADVTWINSHLKKVGQLRQSLVEFPGILLASFHPTLQALKTISRTLDLPFSHLIAPDVQHAANVDIPAPGYARRPGFAFDLKTLAGGEQISMRPGLPFDDTKLREKSTLDAAQRIATLNALSSCLALIQGPPGTGKSYTGVAIIKALLENRNTAKLGPIICVCYTNHALDQLLEHLVKDGVGQLIRLGSRSKSQLLTDLNLHHVSKEALATKTERHEKYELHGELDNILDEIEELMSTLRDPANWKNVKRYLENHQTRYCQEIFGREVDEHGFREVRGKKFNALSSWIKGAPKRITSTRTISELTGSKLQEMSGTERSALHKHWIEQSTVEGQRRLLHILDSYRQVKDSLKRCHQEVDLRCLLNAHIIGVTTTGLARNLDLLRRVRSKVVVIEEAGEVLEAHTLTALLPSVEHAILIGDHEQLRPQINNFDFQSDNPSGARFSLDISLFERLVNPQPGYPKLPCSSLEVQRRMHPSIAELIRSTLYPRLQDDVSVSKHPEVDGMRRRLFWLDHNNKEDMSPSKLEQSYSKTNSWEVEMVAALVSHLVRQGVYQNEDIAVLTPYLGQLQKLKQRLRSSFAIVVGDRDLQEFAAKGIDDDDAEGPTRVAGGVRKTTLKDALKIATVDNFQGEEAKVVIISLVRSNDERRCGFLKTSNRINVLLSRAQHGMYVIGNSETARHVPMWDRVITILENDENLGQTLALCCPRHKETQIEVSEPDDFSIFSPEGGCDRKCISRLACGHACINKCHSEALHNAVRCLERCQRLKKGCDHACAKVCGDPCDPKCQVAMFNIALPCGHVRRKLACHLAQTPENVQCQEWVETVVPGCKHTVKKCADQSVKGMMVDYIMQSSYDDVDLDESPCIIPSCGHILTVESMDGHMEISKYYVTSNDPDAEDAILALKSSSVPFTSEVKNCPICRKPLRDINRYGRIVRRAWIDEATKKFIVWANAQFIPLAARMGQVETRLRESINETPTVNTPASQPAELSSALGRLSLEPLLVAGARDEQIKIIYGAQNKNIRYRDISLLRTNISRFLHDVDEAEQPISRIRALVEDARRRRGITTELTDIPSMLQVRNRLLATVLSLRCDYAILCDFITHRGKTASGENLHNFHLDLALNRKDCEKLVTDSQSLSQPAQEVEGLLYWTRFVALERGRSARLSDEQMGGLVVRACDQLRSARRICNAHRSQTAGMLEEVVEAAKMLRDATFYAPVTNEEKAAVYAAMAQNFSGTGHWYYCVNGHPFTVGECGMPMETSRCPQCGAVVGGNHHQPAAGVTNAADLEAEFGRRGR